MTASQLPSPEEQSPIQGELAAEIRMVREVIRRVVEISEEDEPSFDQYLKLLEGLSLASTRVASLLKMDRQLTGKSDFTDTLNEALEELYEELRKEEGNV
ncbi:MAG: hypothetical protein V2J07_08790 [Anaerolineae bacterium]|jgi:hypothetical protein|nr:hypothetical protein [Anaerolineae bacterium]